MKILYKKRLKEAKPPHRSTERAGAYDVYSLEDHVLEPETTHLFRLGYEISLPDGFVLMVLPRSGLGLKYTTSIINTPGLIDIDYPGELGVALVNHGFMDVEIKKGDRIAQVFLTRSWDQEWEEVDHIERDTERGAEGFGTTGR